MRIAAKINLVLGVVFTAIVIFTFSVLQAVVQPKFQEFELAEAQKNHDRVLRALELLSDMPEAAVRSLAFSDATYDYVAGRPGNEMAPSPLRVDVLTATGAKLVVIRSETGAVIESLSVFSADRPKGTDLRKFLDQASADLKHGQKGIESLSSIVATEIGLVLIAQAPILRSDSTGPALGTITTGTIIDIGKLGRMTSVALSMRILHRQAGGEETGGWKPEHGAQLVSIGKNEIRTSTAIAGNGGRLAVELTSVTDRTMSKMGAEAIGSGILLILAAAAAVVTVLKLALKFMATDRVERLREHMSGAGNAGSIARYEHAASDDEIGDLARSFNAMADHFNQLRDTLGQNAYLSGRADLAAGTLHNVRNGLTPINVIAWRITGLMGASWHSKLAAALVELKQGPEDPDRQGKLEEYVLASTERLLREADEVVSLTGGIAAACNQIGDIIAAEAWQARQDVQEESADLLPILEEASLAANMFKDTAVDVALPTLTAEIAMNRTVLRQVFANLFANAAEAIRASGDAGRVRVEIFGSSELRGRVTVKVSDDGEGMCKETLARIFARGFTSRTERRSGLGLHWSANVLAQAGGSVRAESDGKGRGARFIVELPRAELALKEAA